MPKCKLCSEENIELRNQSDAGQLHDASWCIRMVLICMGLEEPLQHFGVPASSDLQLRKDTLEAHWSCKSVKQNCSLRFWVMDCPVSWWKAQVKSSRTELLKKKFERQFLEVQLCVRGLWWFVMLKQDVGDILQASHFFCSIWAHRMLYYFSPETRIVGYSSIESTDMTVDCHILPVKNSMGHHSGNVVAGMEWVELTVELKI